MIVTTILFLSDRSQALRLPGAVAFSDGVREVAILTAPTSARGSRSAA